MKVIGKLVMTFGLCLVASAGAQTLNSDKVLKIKEISHLGAVDLEKVSELLEAQAELHSIDLLNWDTFQYAPEVKFRIAYSNNEIWLKYYVREKYILAEVAETNGGVASDSCVEFFFDPKADGNYYNFEFNCIGTVHLAYGPGRHDRTFIDKNDIESQIKVVSSLGTEPFTEKTGGHSWEMTIIIPAKILTYDESIHLKGLEAKANFYKCGDRTSERHYLSWNPVGTERPDFHRPEYFGKVFFE